MPKFKASKKAEAQYGRQLRKVAREIAGIVNKHVNGTQLVDEQGMVRLLGLYEKALGPWADRVVAHMLNAVGADNLKAWERSSGTIGKLLKDTMANSKVGAVARQLHTDQVDLIKSLPLDAAQRAQKVAREAQLVGVRANVTAEKIAKDLNGTEDYVANRATLIARTETAKANASLTQARAEYAGVTHYIWRTAGDSDVREAHAELEGEVFAFDDPPEVGDEGAHGPGDFPNCRCYAEPIVPGDPSTEDVTLDRAMAGGQVAPWVPRKAGGRWARW